ncbi:Serine/arginine repetitive matrix protein 2 [Rhodotorula toruloides ATCC 204091]|uniref:Serine/arginine repetitive matrix protein 2 n=1 Tax=Rhodotorula toruloides TaxID=5286 RepID=A0A0K3C9P2_RHOTO|nr:Serine/arginine repetitive matrix protein 2 [Rhodotorula toruloides ATCC 204091]KAK4334007.1 Serine/arginine repetitive matrix protein 2 [Rhodotorula toruloides]PRQ76806.1 Serine/arginine repetitive matrix protein 2 [Rhodotorula toruloides]
MSPHPHSPASPTSPRLDDDDIERQGRQLKPVDTQSSVGSDSAASQKSKPSILSRFSHQSASSLHHAVSRGHHKVHPHYDEHYELPRIKDPIHLCETAISLVLSHPGPPIEVMRKELLPKLYHSAYQHRVNCREHGLNDLLKVVERFRTRFSQVKVKIRSHLMDMDGSATMHAAAIGLVYDITARPHYDSTVHSNKHETEDKKCASVCVMKIYEGRIAQSDLVVDTKEFQMDAHGPELSCSIM